MRSITPKTCHSSCVTISRTEAADVSCRPGPAAWNRCLRRGLPLAAAVLFSAAAAQDGVPSPPADAQQPAVSRDAAVPATVAGPIEHWNDALGRVEAALAGPDVAEEALDRIRTELKRIRSEIGATIAAQRLRLPEIEARTRALGETPKASEPPEPAAVTEQRAQLRKALGEITGTLKAAEEAELRADLLERQGEPDAARRIRAADSRSREKPPVAIAVGRYRQGCAGRAASHRRWAWPLVAGHGGQKPVRHIGHCRDAALGRPLHGRQSRHRALPAMGALRNRQPPGGAPHRPVG